MSLIRQAVNLLWKQELVAVSRTQNGHSLAGFKRNVRPLSLEPVHTGWSTHTTITRTDRTDRTKQLFHYPYRPYRPYRPYEATFSLPVQSVRRHIAATRADRTDATQLYGVRVRSVRCTCAVSTAHVRSVLSVRSVRVVPVRSTEWSCMGIWGSKATVLLNPAKLLAEAPSGGASQRRDVAGGNWEHASQAPSPGPSPPAPQPPSPSPSPQKRKRCSTSMSSKKENGVLRACHVCCVLCRVVCRPC